MIEKLLEFFQSLAGLSLPCVADFFLPLVSDSITFTCGSRVVGSKFSSSAEHNSTVETTCLATP